ncbi:hypothetical protein F5X96DRAFT_614487, partial [Biscogniauxia mediterranea]
MLHLKVLTQLSGIVLYAVFGDYQTSLPCPTFSLPPSVVFASSKVIAWWNPSRGARNQYFGSAGIARLYRANGYHSTKPEQGA